MYQESRIFIWSWLLVIIAIAACVSAIVGSQNQWRDANEGWIFVGSTAAMAVFMGLLAVTFFKYTIELKSGHLQFGYSFWSAETPVDEIESAAAEKLTFRNWLGQGWRIDTRKRIGYIVNFREGVELKLKSGRVYVISCRDPQALIEALGITA
jgi:hypothetical protein